MPYSAEIYIGELHALQADLFFVMGRWPSDASFQKAKEAAETAAPLIAGEIGRLLKTSKMLNPSDPVALRIELERLHDLMSKEDKHKFAQYIAMLDSLINEGIS